MCGGSVGGPCAAMGGAHAATGSSDVEGSGASEAARPVHRRVRVGMIVTVVLVSGRFISCVRFFIWAAGAWVVVVGRVVQRWAFLVFIAAKVWVGGCRWVGGWFVDRFYP